MPSESVRQRTIRLLAAEGQTATRRPSRKLLQRLRSNSRQISDAHRTLTELIRRSAPVPAEAEWLIDNYYVIDEVIRQIRDHLPPGYYRELPTVTKGPRAGLPRIYPLAETILGGGDGPLSEDEIRAAVGEYQQTTALKIGELWAVPIMLRLAVIELLRCLVDQLMGTIAERRRAADDLANLRRDDRLRLPETPSDTYLAKAWDAIREGGPSNESLDEWASRHLADPHAVAHREFCRQAASQVSIGNAVTTLRLLGIIDWKEFFEATCLIDAVLANDPGGVYDRQDFATRDRCRRAVESFARASRRPELDVAQSAVAAASREGSPGHVSYYLIGEGRTRFGRELGERRPVWRKIRYWLRGRPGVIYFSLVAALTLAAAVPAIVGTAGAAWGVIPFAVLAILIVSSEIGVQLTNTVIRTTTSPRVLARLDFRNGIPPENATFVVIPTLIGRPDQARGLVERLERHALSNPDPALRFALLIDFTDAPTETLPEDDACVRALQVGIEQLNATSTGPGGPRFSLFHRRRQFNPAEGCWMGWERKRGKLDEFNRLLRGATDTTYVLNDEAIKAIPHVRYVLTLDADTVMPRDAARQMIATLAHPLNKPRLSEDGRRVVAGYGILQPKVSFLYHTGFRSWFARLFAGSAGVDPYSAASSDTYMDLFRRGSFTGKGLYEVDAFDATVGPTFPENAILSHDLIESNYARCALATDIELFDEFPAKSHAYARRDHRWIRGDWQLLPWLGLTVPTPHGRKPNVLPLHERWKILDNLRRSLLAPATVALLVMAWTRLPSPSWAWTLFALLPLLLPGLFLTYDTALTLHSRRAWRSLPSKLRFEFVNTFGQAFLQLSFFADWARLSLDAIGRTLYRLVVTRKNLLEWETAAASEARLGDGFLPFFRSMWPAPVFAFVVAGLILVVAPERLAVAAPVLLLWLASPVIAFVVSRPRALADAPLSATDEAELRRIARKTWSFFETYVGETDNWLPPDNYQESPLGLSAHRTSPTNIGLYLLAVQAAHDLQYIGLDEVVSRTHKAFDSLDKLECYRGHFYNWYETNTLRTMHPPYVSTVDSGNLLACFIALKHGLRELAEAHPDREVELTTLAGRADVKAAAMKFGFLYNPDRELFSIGFNAATNRLDSNHYDLLASESCIASYLAVARGDVPRNHWFRLGRLVTVTAGRVGLVSWGGTMFEYLMPRILLPTVRGVLLDRAQHTAVARQIEYGRETGRPWGVSESGFALLDAGQVYQYQSFGVPGLGLKRGLERDAVVAPYATLMAVDVDAVAAVKNFAALREAGGEGPYGFYEAIDYSPDHAGGGDSPRVVRSYMAHHQGMGLLSILNRLTDGLVRKRFAREPAVRAAELLLEERVPYDAPVIDPDGPDGDRLLDAPSPTSPLQRRIATPHTPVPRTHLLSNGGWTTMVTNAGAGYSRWRGLDVTRWRADATADGDGPYLYLRDRRSGAVWSATHLPTDKTPDEYEVTYSIDKAEFRRRDGEIETLLEIVVAPDRDVEVRRVTVTNHGERARVLDLTSYAEIVLMPHAGDVAHPAFGKLFVETEWLAAQSTILCRRRPRSESQQPVYAWHALIAEAPGKTSFESSREAFLGRRRSADKPRALDADIQELGGTAGAVLDPIVALRRTLTLKPGEKGTVTFLTGAADTREEALAHGERYGTTPAVAHAFELAWAHARIELQGSHWKPEDVHLFQRLAGHLHFPNGPLRADEETLLANRLGQSALWAFGISGDVPILLLSVHSRSGLTHLEQLVKAHSYWRAKGFPVDLVILLENAGGYQDDVHDEVVALIRQEGSGDSLNRAAGIFVRKGSQMTGPERTVLLTAARVILDDRAGAVATQADAVMAPRPLPARRTLPAAAFRFDDLPPLNDLHLENEYGGFRDDGREYVIRELRVPPAPWSNVIANEKGGFLVTDSGGGFTWAGNSQSNRITPWGNDPVLDAPGEALYVHDESADALWCPTPRPMPTTGPVRVRHGQGWTTFERSVDKVRSELTVFVAPNDPVKISLLTLRNTGPAIKRLEIAYYAEWVLGTNREATNAYVVTRIDPETGALLAGNRFHPDYPNRIAFADTDLRPRTVTGDRAEFLGRNGRLAAPASFARIGLSGTTGAGLDPCAAMRGSITLSPGETRTIVFVLGQGEDPTDARRMVREYRTVAAAQKTLKAVKEQWSAITGAVVVETPDPAFDVLMNRWLLYQTASCRLWGRSAFFQSGGAYGFRDQLQDGCALVHTLPNELRTHLLRAARRQFVEGDVQHWWHEPAGNGVRTKFSDDFLWLPYAVATYVAATGDLDVLNEVVPYLEAPVLTADQHEVYGIPSVSEQVGTLLEHCERAIAHGWKLGAHGLPLMGCGDWNDGMNAVGIGGRGESVWVAWFQCVVLEQFAAIEERQGDATLAEQYRTNATKLRDALETHAWDGDWYRRAFFDDGTPLGSAANDECRIDSIAQSWAVIADGPTDRAKAGMASLEKHLIKPADRLILLFEPPFDDGPLKPGYIKGYLPGIRENGGQYTHAALWTIKALAGLGKGDAAMNAWQLISPVTMPVNTYRGEPYVIAADVYSQPPHVGRAGWTWYTGSASWMYRVGLEDLLGLRREGTRLRLTPRVPASWPGFHLRYRFGTSTYAIKWERSPDAAAQIIRIDGVQTNEKSFALIDDGKEHIVLIVAGRESAQG